MGRKWTMSGYNGDFAEVAAMSRRLALFDLDNTLLSGDSDHAFGEFLIRKELVDAQTHRANNDRFYEDYKNNNLDIHAYVEFTLGPVLQMDVFSRQSLLDEYTREVIATMIPDKATELVETHRDKGDYCVIITATNSFITTPIAAAFGVNTLLATDLEMRDTQYTGRIKGIPCYREGKVAKVEQWLANGSVSGHLSLDLSLDNSIFYTDSINDLPLLERVGEAVVVNPDARLAAIASDRGWPELDLR